MSEFGSYIHVAGCYQLCINSLPLCNWPRAAGVLLFPDFCTKFQAFPS